MNELQIDDRRTLQMVERCLAHEWDIPPDAFRVLPHQLVQIAAGITTDSRGEPWSATSRMKAMRILAVFRGQNLAAARIALEKHLAEHAQLHLHRVELSPAERRAHIEAILNEVITFDVVPTDVSSAAGEAGVDKRRGSDAHQPDRPGPNGNGQA